MSQGRLVGNMYNEKDQDRAQETTSLLRRNRDLAILYDIAGYLNHQVDVHEALQGVLARVTELLDMKTGWVWLLNEQGHTYLAASQALPPYLSDHPERMTGSCLCLDTFLSGSLEGAGNVDVLRCSRLKNAERDSDPTALGLRFHASVPIYAGNTRLGVLNVASEGWRELEPQELQLLHIISDQIGLAIQRARISAEHTRSATRLATTEERNRLAREIHDTLAQGLAAIALQLETADALSQTRPERAHEAIQRALKLARGNLEEARRSVMDLRAAPLQDRTLVEALAELVQHEQQAQTIHVQFRSRPSTNFPVLPARVEVTLYRIAQEALTNALKHSGAEHIEVILDGKEQCVYLIVRDDGKGFDPGEVNQSPGHFGLTGMAERVKLMGGHLCIESEPETGTCIAVEVPY
ncbi:MAG: GAF domain-containing sensor histidine kinase [Ktedonobacteraceae bacterium]|nr:GAF domain-containing sensor histidine kinase [Ktedonobacteraceae bacterium]